MEDGGWKEPHEVEREVHQLLGVKSVSWGGGEDGKNRTKWSVKYTSYW